MALETLAVAVGPNAEARIEELSRAILDIAAPTGATVVLAHVFSEGAYEKGIEEAGYDPSDPPDPDTLAARLESIHTITDRLAAEDVEFRVRADVGQVADGVLRAVEATDADMLLVSGRERSPTGKAVFGSTAHQILMNAPCLVTFVREDVGDAGASS